MSKAKKEDLILEGIYILIDEWENFVTPKGVKEWKRDVTKVLGKKIGYTNVRKISTSRK